MLNKGCRKPELKTYILTGLLIIGYVLIVRSLSFNMWKNTHWLFSMHEGLYSRALTGSVMRMFFPGFHGSQSFIKAAATVITFVLATMLVVIGFRYWISKGDYTGLFAAGVLIVSPGTIQFFARDSGRFDQIGYILLLSALCLLPLIPHRIHWLLVSAAAVILVLIHEVLLFMAVPVLIAVVLADRMDDGESPADALRLCIYSFLTLLPAVIIASLALTLWRLDYNPEVFEQVKYNLQSIADFPVHEESLMVHFRSIEDNFVYTGRNFNLINTANSLLAFIALIPSGLAAYFLLAHSLKSKTPHTANLFTKIIKALVKLLCFTPLLLFLIGIDYPRWMAAVVINLFITGMTVELQGRRDTVYNRDSDTVRQNLYLGFAIAFSLAVGPVSATSAPASLVKIGSLVKKILILLF